MKIVFVSHPWAAISEGGATGIFSCQVASRLKETDDVFIYGQIGNCGNAPGISFRHFSISLDRRINGFLKKIYRALFY